MLTLPFFHRKSATFVISRNTDINLILMHNLILLNCFEFLKVVLIYMVAILIMSARLATLGLLKIKLF